MLGNLPHEILDLIIEKLPRSDVVALSQVSKGLFQAALPALYSTFAIEIDESFPIIRSNRPYQFPTRFRAEIHHVHFVSTFHESLESRCPHDKRIGNRLPEIQCAWRELPPFAESHQYSRICHRLLSILQGLKDNHLRSLSWDVGTCVPKVIFWPNLIRHHEIQNLSLITDGTCKSPQTLQGLRKFTSLRTFCWQGLPSVDDLVHLKACLTENAKHLRALKINLIVWEQVANSWLDRVRLQEEVRPLVDPALLGQEALGADAATSWLEQSTNFFARGILSLQLKTFETTFPHLTRLSLACVSFQSMAAEMACALNFGSLRHLSLWRCPATVKLLSELVERQSAVKLRTLELAVSHVRGEEDTPRIFPEIIRFLNSFCGLEDLFLLLPAEDDDEPYGDRTWNWSDLFCGVCNHRVTLTRLVCHARTPDDRFRYWDEELFCYGEDGPLRQCLKLKHIGLSCDSMRDVQCDTETMKPRPSFHLLHVRQSRDNDEHSPFEAQQPEFDHDGDYCVALFEVWTSMHPVPRIERRNEVLPRSFLRLAQWAFAPDGLPNLQILAYGDFSYSGRYDKWNILLCRNELSTARAEDIDNEYYCVSDLADLTFRLVTESDVALCQLVRDNQDMLGACPVDNVMGTRKEGL